MAEWLFLTSRVVRQLVFDRERGQAAVRGTAQLLKHVLDVPSDGVFADNRRGGDLIVGFARRNEPEDFDLA